MRLTLQSRQVLYSCSSSHSISSLHPRSNFHQISESPSLQTKRIRLLPEDLLNLFDEVRKADPLFPVANCLNQWELFFPVYKPVRLYLHFILTMSLEECQTKNFGMNLLLHAIFKFCTTKRLFKYFRQRYSDQHLKCLNKLIKIRGRIRTFLSKTAFLTANIAQRTLPKSVRFRVEKSLATWSPKIERAFMQDEIGKNRSMVASLRTKYRSLWQEVRQFCLSSIWYVSAATWLSLTNKKKPPTKRRTVTIYVFYFNTALATRLTSRRTTSQTYLTTNCQILNSLFFPTGCRSVYCWRVSHSVTHKHELWIWFTLSYAMMKALLLTCHSVTHKRERWIWFPLSYAMKTLLRLAAVRDTKQAGELRGDTVHFIASSSALVLMTQNGNIYRALTQTATCLLRRYSSKHIAENSSWIRQTTTRSRHYWRKEIK